MLACSAPPSVNSSVSSERDPRSCSREIGGFTMGCSHACSSWSSLSRGREFRGERGCAQFAIWRVACPVSRVTLSLHEPFMVLWTRALSPGLFTHLLCPLSFSVVQVAVFGLLPVLSGSLVLSEWLFAVLTSAHALLWPSRGPV